MTPTKLGEIRSRMLSEKAAKEGEDAHVCSFTQVRWKDSAAMSEALKTHCRVECLDDDGKVRGTTSRQCKSLDCFTCMDDGEELRQDRETLLALVDDLSQQLSWIREKATTVASILGQTEGQPLPELTKEERKQAQKFGLVSHPLTPEMRSEALSVLWVGIEGKIDWWKV